MEIVKEREPYSINSPRYYGKIYTQAGSGNKWILIGIDQAIKILRGEIYFQPGKQGGIGVLQIGDYDFDKIYCLEREFRSDWEKVVRKLCKLMKITNNEDINLILKQQPQLPPVVRKKKSRPTREQLMTDPRYTESKIYNELAEFDEEDDD